MNFLTLPFFAELEQARSVLLAGAGGGYDVFSGLPLYFGFRSAGKKVHLANLSFSHLEGATGTRLAPAVLEVTADSRCRGYFPEYYLSRWFRQQGDDVPVYCFEKVGCVPLREAYQAVVEHVQADAVVLIDGGTDSLMRGDVASIAAAADLDVPRKFLVCLGFGVDSFHGVCHSHALEAVADLTRQGAFLGAFSLLREMPEVRQYAAAVEAVFQAMPDAPSIVSASILSALEGHYGDHHRTARTRGSVLWVNPLMTHYWSFRLESVARRILYLNEIKQTHTMWDLVEAIDSFRETAKPIRGRTPIPDVSLTRRLTR